MLGKTKEEGGFPPHCRCRQFLCFSRGRQIFFGQLVFFLESNRTLREDNRGLSVKDCLLPSSPSLCSELVSKFICGCWWCSCLFLGGLVRLASSACFFVVGRRLLSLGRPGSREDVFRCGPVALSFSPCLCLGRELAEDRRRSSLA